MKVDIVTSDDIKIYYSGKFQDFTARYIINITSYSWQSSSQNERVCVQGLGNRSYDYYSQTKIYSGRSGKHSKTTEKYDLNYFGKNRKHFEKRTKWGLLVFSPFPDMFSTAVFLNLLTLSSIYTRFNTLKKISFRKTLWKKVKLLILSNSTFSHNVFLKLFSSMC